MEISSKTTTLNNGSQIPLCGLGTYKLSDPSTTVYEGIKVGLRLIDTAFIYKNEKEVGEGIRKALEEKIVKREDLYIITKLWPTEYNQAEQTLTSQLKDLQLDYIDLYLIHWPNPAFNKERNKFEEVSILKLWAEFESFVSKGYVKSIGVSNFNSQLLLELIHNSKTIPSVNEIELHPYNDQKDLRKLMNLYGIVPIAYNSLVKGSYTLKRDYVSRFQLFDEEKIEELSKKYMKTKGQIVLNWAISQGIVVIPKASSSLRIEENLGSVLFRMSEEDVDDVSKLNCDVRFSIKPDFAGGFNFFS